MLLPQLKLHPLPLCFFRSEPEQWDHNQSLPHTAPTACHLFQHNVLQRFALIRNSRKALLYVEAKVIFLFPCRESSVLHRRGVVLFTVLDKSPPACVCLSIHLLYLSVIHHDIYSFVYMCIQHISLVYTTPTHLPVNLMPHAEFIHSILLTVLQCTA